MASPPPRARRGAPSATATFAAWCRPRSPTVDGPSRGSSTRSASRSQPRSGAGGAHRQRHAEPRAPAAHDRERLAVGAGHGDVAPLHDLDLLARDRPDRRPQLGDVVQPDVGEHRDAAVPRVRRIQPAAKAHLDQREVEPAAREVEEHHGGQQLELGRRAEPARDPVGDRQHLLDERGRTRPRSIGRPSTTIRSRYVTRCGLGVSPIRYPAARSADPASAMTLPLPLVPATSAPRTSARGGPARAAARGPGRGRGGCRTGPATRSPRAPRRR